MEKSKTKILYFVTKGNFGGAQRYVFDLATNLSQEKYEIAVLMGEGTILKDKLSLAGIRTIEIRSLKRNFNLFNDLSAFWYTLKILNKESPDILHLNSSKAGALGAIAGRIVGIKNIIFTGHGWAFNEDRNIVSRLAIATIHWLTIILCHKTIAVSERIKNQILLFHFSEKRIVQIYNGIEKIDFFESDVARKEIKIDIKEPFWIGTISELHKNKGLDFLIKAFSSVAKNFEEVALVIIGEGEERENLIKLSKNLQIGERVHFIGFKRDANKYLKAFNIFSLTSRTEAFPYAILEAGLAKLPIIASRVGGIPEVIANNENGILVERGNVFDIEYHLRELIKDSKKREKFGKKIQQDVEKKFSLKLMTEKTVNLYDEVKKA